MFSIGLVNVTGQFITSDRVANGVRTITVSVDIGSAVIRVEGDGDRDIDCAVYNRIGDLIGTDSGEICEIVVQQTMGVVTIRITGLMNSFRQPRLFVNGRSVTGGQAVETPLPQSAPPRPTSPPTPRPTPRPTPLPAPLPRVDTPPPSTPSPGSGLAVVPVFYATDREHEPGTLLSYGSGRRTNGNLYLGRFDVSIPRDHKMGSVERPSIWTFGREDQTKHLVIMNRMEHSYDAFYRDIQGIIGRAVQKDAFVFIHGFNVSFESAVFRTAQIAYDLGFDGAPILYSWPSAQSLTPIGYATDAANNDWTVPHLRWFLEDVATKTGANRVHLIAHSMGNKALVNALDRMPAASTRKFAQIVLTAPDIDADTFIQLADAVRRNGQMATLYASANDTALRASMEFQTYRRAGDTRVMPVVVPGIDTVDVSAVDTNLLGHFYYGDNSSVISDMFLVLTQGLPPAKRPRLKPEGIAPNQFWRFAR
jgi:esterase/lipase superfamily enzyme